MSVKTRTNESLEEGTAEDRNRNEGGTLSKGTPPGRYSNKDLCDDDR